MWMSGLPTLMLFCHMYAWHVRSPEERSEFPGTRVTADCESPCQRSELNQGPLEEQSVLSTTKPSCQLSKCFNVKHDHNSKDH